MQASGLIASIDESFGEDIKNLGNAHQPSGSKPVLLSNQNISQSYSDIKLTVPTTTTDEDDGIQSYSSLSKCKFVCTDKQIAEVRQRCDKHPARSLNTSLQEVKQSAKKQ